MLVCLSGKSLTRRWAYIGTSMLRIPVEGWRSSSDWIVVMDMGGRFSCSMKGDIGSMGEAGWIEDLVIGRVLVRENGDEMEVVDIVEVMDRIEGVGTKSG